MQRQYLAYLVKLCSFANSLDIRTQMSPNMLIARPLIFKMCKLLYQFLLIVSMLDIMIFRTDEGDWSPVY